ncbi:MAG: winged helix DNA-binding domain-containing protein [Acidimicrobiales bacterium]
MPERRTSVTERVLTRRELNRAVLARQLLLERARLPITRALERVAGLQTQYAPSGYIGLWSRVHGFERDHLTQALERRTVVQATLMRSTIHLVPAVDYWPFAMGVRRTRRDWWLRLNKDITARQMEVAAERLRTFLSDGPRRATEVDRFMGTKRSGSQLWLDLVRVPPSGTWDRRRAGLYGVAEDWLGLPDTSEADGLAHLVWRYLHAFGPASRADIASWTGVPVTPLDPVLEGLDLHRFRDEQGGVLLDVPGAPLPDAGTPAPPRFIPTWDAILLVHARRAAILPEEYRKIIFSTKKPQSMPTFMVDGRIVGAWKFEDGHVKLDPFEPLPRAARRDLEEEGERLAAFHG